MKKIVISGLILSCFVLNGFSNLNDVIWIGGTGNWMVSGNWSNSVYCGWNIPGWVSGNSSNIWDSTDSGWNLGEAIISSGTVQITSSSAPDGEIESMKLAGASNPSLGISADVTLNGLHIGREEGPGQISQTAGNVKFLSGTAVHIGRNSEGTYNLSGGTLTHESTSAAATRTYIGVYDGGKGVFNQTGGTFIKNGTVQQNIYVGYKDGSEGILNLSGGDFKLQVGDILSFGEILGSKGELNLSGTANLLVGDGTAMPAADEPTNGWGIISAGRHGRGVIRQTGGSFEGNYLKVAEYSDGFGSYMLSGGSLDLHAYLYLVMLELILGLVDQILTILR